MCLCVSPCHASPRGEARPNPVGAVTVTKHTFEFLSGSVTRNSGCETGCPFRAFGRNASSGSPVTRYVPESSGKRPGGVWRAPGQLGFPSKTDDAVGSHVAEDGPVPFPRTTSRKLLACDRAHEATSHDSSCPRGKRLLASNRWLPCSHEVSVPDSGRRETVSFAQNLVMET